MFWKTYVDTEGNFESIIRIEINERLASPISAFDSSRNKENFPHSWDESKQQQCRSKAKKQSLQHPPNLQNCQGFGG